MTTEEMTAPVSGQQVNLEPTSQPANENAPETQSPETENTQKSYYDSEQSLRTKINELTQIAERGSQEEVQNAMNELSEIEQVLERSKKQPRNTSSSNKPIDAIVSSTEPVIEKKPDTVEDDKKFSVYWQGQKVEREDKNNLLGYNNTGELKAALIKAQLQLQQHDTERSSLTERLRDAEQKIVASSQPKPVQPPVQRHAVQQPIIGSVTKPIPPIRPNLTTNDPSLYTEDDIKSLDAYSKATDSFNRKMVDYLTWIESRPAQQSESMKSEMGQIKAKIDELDSERQTLQAERKRLQEEKADMDHWNQFKVFQDRHKTFQTSMPVKELNAAMNKWMDNIAAANGVKSISEGNNDFYNQRAQIVTKYLNNDAQVLVNAQGIKPPEDHATFFRLFELYHALNKYRENTVLGKNATLHDAYMRMKDDAGEIDEDLNTIRVNERTKAAEQFANGVQELQNHAVNIDPKQSSGGPDINELGITSSDLKWFSSITPDKIHLMKHKNKELYNKWNAIADKIEKFAR